jgi:hypothetical protein
MTDAEHVIQPGEIAEMREAALRVIRHAQLRPSEADSTSVANAQRFLDLTAAQHTSGSGNQ